METKLSSLEMVRRATMNKIGRFKKQDIMELCPSLILSSVEGALRKLVAEGELKREGNGKNTCYYRLNFVGRKKCTLTEDPPTARKQSHLTREVLRF